MCTSRTFTSTAAICLVLGGGTLADAQVTKYLMPATNTVTCSTPATLDGNSQTYVQGNDGTGKEGSTYFADGTSRPAYDKIKVWVEDPTDEIIYFGATAAAGSTNIEYRFKDPTGAIIYQGTVASAVGQPGYIARDRIQAYLGPNQLDGTTCGYDAVEVTTAVRGEHTLEFRNAANDKAKYRMHPVDVTVGRNIAATPSAVDGRVYAKRWHLTTNDATNGNHTIFHTYTPDSVVVAFDMNGMQPWGFAVNFNRFGSDNTGNLEEDRRSNADQDSPAEYPVFLTNPDLAVWPNPAPIAFSISSFNECKTGSFYCVNIASNRETQYNVYLDLDGSGAYEQDGRDVVFPYRTVSPGDNCIPWDGRDNFGAEVPQGSGGKVIVEMLAGLTHFPVWDAEIVPNGFNASIARPLGLDAPKLYWDNTKLKEAKPIAPSTVSNYDGCTGNCNAYTGSNNENVNTWVATVAKTANRVFTLNGICDSDADGIADDVDQDDDNDGISDEQEGLVTTTINVEKYVSQITNSSATSPTRVVGAPDGYAARLNASNFVSVQLVTAVPAGGTFDVIYSARNAADELRVEAWNGSAWVTIATLTGVAGNALVPRPVAMSGGFSSNRFRLTSNAAGMRLDALAYGQPVSQSTAPDSDGDGLADPYDLDSNGNGIPDLIEAGGTDTDGDGRVDGLAANGSIPAGQDADADGWIDALDDTDGQAGTPIDIAADLDSDGVVNYLDLDDDQDGLSDLMEVGGTDVDGDGRLDTPSDADGDGLADEIDPTDGLAAGSGAPHFTTAADGNGDNLPDTPCSTCDFDGDGYADYADLDSDNDGIPDSIEGGEDADANGVIAGDDANSDGLIDGNLGLQPRDTDGDGLRDAVDLDADDDGIVDNTEAFGTGAYTVPSGTYDADGLDTAYDGAAGAHGGSTTIPVDTDGDGLADYVDLDSDDDSSPDAVEGHDTNGDDVVDGSDSSPANTGAPTGFDADRDGIDDGYDNDNTSRAVTNAPAAGAGLTPASHPERAASQNERDWRHADLNVEGFVFEDANGDGIRGPLERGISGATVALHQNGTLVTSTTTDGQGDYIFLRQPAGTGYTVLFSKPAGYGPASPKDASWSDDNDSDADEATGETDPFSLATNTTLAPTSAGYGEAALPITLTGFRADAKACDVVISWSTAAEWNASHFTVEVRSDVSGWTELAREAANNRASSYSVADAQAGRTSYYRLKSVDLDGTVITSRVVTASTSCELAPAVYAYPNPTGGELTLANVSNEIRTALAVDLLGRGTQLSVSNGRVDLSALSPGRYALRVGSDVISVLRR